MKKMLAHFMFKLMERQPTVLMQLTVSAIHVTNM